MSLFAWAGLAATTFGAALLQAAGGFGFAVVATPLFLIFIDPASAVQLVIIITVALTAVVLPKLWRAVAPPLLLRLTLGSLAGLPPGLIAFRYADPRVVRVTAGATILAFAAVLVLLRRRGRGVEPGGGGLAPIGMTPARDLAAGAISGAATALVAMSGPPVLIYLVLAGVSPRTARATLLAFFALVYAATLAAHGATVGVPGRIWIAAIILIPFALVGGLAGRPLGDRLGESAFAMLAIGLLALAGLYTLAAVVLDAGR